MKKLSLSIIVGLILILGVLVLDAQFSVASNGRSSTKTFLSGVSTSTFSCADVNRSGVSDGVDLNIIVDVAFNGSTSTYVTDVNGSGATDVFDVNDEVDYLYSGGPEPTGCSTSTLAIY